MSDDKGLQWGYEKENGRIYNLNLFAKKALLVVFLLQWGYGGGAFLRAEKGQLLVEL